MFFIQANDYFAYDESKLILKCNISKNIVRNSRQNNCSEALIDDKNGYKSITTVRNEKFRGRKF